MSNLQFDTKYIDLEKGSCQNPTRWFSTGILWLSTLVLKYQMVKKHFFSLFSHILYSKEKLSLKNLKESFFFFFCFHVQRNVPKKGWEHFH